MELQEELRHMALYDSLTKLRNRRAIVDRLEEELSRSRREGKRLCIGLLDLDFFKNVNDTLGHLVGDEVLQETARRIRSSLRNYDIAGRYGGEEFSSSCPERRATTRCGRSNGSESRGGELRWRHRTEAPSP